MYHSSNFLFSVYVTRRQEVFLAQFSSIQQQPNRTPLIKSLFFCFYIVKSAILTLVTHFASPVKEQDMILPQTLKVTSVECEMLIACSSW